MEFGVKRGDGTWFMSAYWFAFDETGEDAIDAVLSSVAWAGKSYHSTEHWSDDREDAPSHTEQIQAAANAAAAEIAKLRAELEEARAMPAMLRDRFAISVASGELSSQSREWGGYPPGDEARFAERVWKLTDALLAARAEGRS